MFVFGGGTTGKLDSSTYGTRWSVWRRNGTNTGKLTVGSGTLNLGGNISGATLSALLVTNSITISTATGNDATVAGTPPLTQLFTATPGAASRRRTVRMLGRFQFMTPEYPIAGG